MPLAMLFNAETPFNSAAIQLFLLLTPSQELCRVTKVFMNFPYRNVITPGVFLMKLLSV